MRRERQPTPPFLEAMNATDVAVWRVWLDDSREYSVVVTRDGFSPTDERWHVSVAGRDDVPPWADLAEIVHELRPGVPFAVGIPPKSWWMNVHPHTLHAIEVKDEALIDHWRLEARGHTPT